MHNVLIISYIAFSIGNLFILPESAKIPALFSTNIQFIPIMNKKTLLLFSCLAMLASCRSDRHATALFERAETLMQEAPDSALLLLRGISPKTLDSKALRARHALLYSQALDKNGIDLREDSIIAPAAAYYTRHGNKRDKAYTNYYLGRIRNNAGRTGEAALLMLEAEKYAIPTGETNLLGLIYNCRGNLYYSQYSLDEALEMYTKADSCFRQIGKIVFAGYMTKAKATTYALMQKYPESQAEYHKALAIFDSIGNHQQICLITSSLAHQMKEAGTSTAIIKQLLNDTYKQHSSGVIPSCDYPIWAWIYLNENQIDSAQYFCFKTSQTKLSTNQRCGTNAILSQIAEAQGNYKTAASKWKDTYILLDSLSQYEKKNLIQRIEERYENKELQIRNEMLHMKNTYIVAIGSLCLLLLLGIFASLFRRWRQAIRQKAKELEATRIMIEDLTENQVALQKECAEMIVKLDNGSLQATHLMELLESRLDGIQQLLETAYSSACNPKKLYDYCKQYANNMNLSESVTSDLRDLINIRYHGVLEHLHTHHPKVTNSEINLIAMQLLGFSNNSIRLIFNHENQDSLYSRRTRLREKVGLPAYAKLEDYLIYISEQLKNGEKPDTPSEYASKLQVTDCQ